MGRAKLPPEDLGRWMPPGRVPGATLALLGTVLPFDAATRRTLQTLMDRGILCRDSFYVPSPAELYHHYVGLRAIFTRGRPEEYVRWVMCWETLVTLAVQHRDRVAQVASPWDALGLELDAPEPETAMVVERADPVSKMGGRLFGMAIRIDPAARRPLLEVSTDE